VVCLFLFSCFCHYANPCSGPYCGLFHCILDLFEYYCTPRKRSSKLFTNSLSPCGGISVSIFVFFAIMLIPAQDLTVTRFAASWTRLNTTANRENAPANRLQIHQVLVEVCLFPFSCFWHYATLCLRPYCGSFCCLLGSFEHSCIPQKCSSKPFTNSSSP